MTLSYSAPLIGALGDLVEDIVVDLFEPIRYATDSEARIERRRGGSAANVTVAAVVAGGRGRFLGNVGADRLGDELLSSLVDVGVDVDVTRSGRTGTVVALIDGNGERSLVTDRGSSGDVESVPDRWLEGLDVLHVPAYAFTASPLALAATDALIAARLKGATTSIDTSAVPVIEVVGPTAFREMVAQVEPTVLFCNADEAAALGVSGPVTGAALTVVKNGPGHAVIHTPGSPPLQVPARQAESLVDTTGAGDAFAAAFLVGLATGNTPEKCAELGHDLAARSLANTGSLQGLERGSLERDSLEQRDSKR